MREKLPIFLRLDTPLSENASEDEDGKGAKLTPLELDIERAQADAYTGVCVDITNEAWKKRWSTTCLSGSDTPEPSKSQEDIQRQQRVAELWRVSDTFKREEVNFIKLEEADNLMAFASEWLELDSPDEWVRLDSELALRQELSYASYMNLATVIVPPPRNRQHVADYARAINGCFYNSPPVLSSFIQLSIRMPLYDPARLAAAAQTSNPSKTSFGSSSAKSDGTNRPPSEADIAEMWELWDTVRTICGYTARLTVTLDLTYPFPSSSLLERWHAEPLRNILLPASSFVSNNRGYPVLPKATQNFIKDIVKYRPAIILSSVNKELHKNGGPSAYQQYVRYIEKTSPYVVAMEQDGSVENFAAGYWDYLQAPLQPLMDNLQSTTYEVFERDPVKYAKYEQAIYLALSDRPPDSETIICVAGAGRGPLVTRALRAVTRSTRKAIIYAVEKNPSAFVTLQEKREREWGAHVKLLFGDMRVISVPEKADILISELLGSFGDNELSPECLDGASRFLKEDGISIPSSYTAYLNPLSSSRLHNDASVAPRDLKGAETPYVVMFQAVIPLSPDPQECWEFVHPRKNVTLDDSGLPFTNSHNTRSARLTFQIPQAGVVHGLAGYFEACLYGDIGLSIHPHRKDAISPNMLSWFPLFFPLKDPLFLPANSELDVHIWRLTDKKKVWYEWFVESYYHVPASGPVLPTQLSPAHTHTRLSLSPELGNVLPPSPMVDAPAAMEHKMLGDHGYLHPTGEQRLKIGQSALHNPGGRSSWMGL